MKTSKMCAIFSNQHEYSRLKPLTDERALSTLYFAGKYRLMDFALSSIVNADINHVYTLISQEKVRSYLDHLGGGKEWGLDTIGSYEYLDFYQNLMRRRSRGENYFDDVIFFLKTCKMPYTVFIGNKMAANFDLKAILHFHQSNDNRITPVFKRVEKDSLAPDDHTFVLSDNNVVTEQREAIELTSEGSFNLSANVYVMNTDWLIHELEKAQKSGASYDVSERLAALAVKEKANAYEYTGYLRNIHDIPSYYQANLDMLEKDKRDSLLYGNQKIITRIRNEVGTYYDKESDVKNTLISTGCTVKGEIKNSIVSRRVNFAKDSVAKNAVIMANCKIKSGADVEYAILDKNVVIEKGVTVKGKPDSPVVIKKGSVISKDFVLD
ncbi:glucose-1-phosphate adenylyltransferase subunit GlgD [Lactobacillus delbrueckii subsp. indicus]|jgi:glucose-1-phosphate adenylyltransferase|uniref:glucose-1-phosphate adenylyltransferase subunit GlgD n=1 Tax=Lactobacillus delbrueckii TaxID=1584 RepID=UPI0022237B4A|nr:glucose-1-phosphate adenylyltransferase subunit GlgD [Lactobacillus delbrueckii]UYX12427.1 glucose-1-phosphate adenylyltransferase subunit GlgD [Lactobacillus delbrueckii]UYY84241.1 glucose-1-phosphate adenylyltransferase subunit GlgD [Lactobacillus delbrueckii subsp. indicus]